MSDQQQVNFNEILNDQPAEEAVSVSEAEKILNAIQHIEDAFVAKIADLEANVLALEGRLSLTERYLSFLLTKNEDFKDWLKQQVADMTDAGVETVKAVLENAAVGAAVEVKGDSDGQSASGQSEG